MYEGLGGSAHLDGNALPWKRARYTRPKEPCPSSFPSCRFSNGTLLGGALRLLTIACTRPQYSTGFALGLRRSKISCN